MEQVQDNNSNIPVLNRIEQQRHYGLDCGDVIRFDAGTWLPGGEHVRKITVRNVSKHTIKFKYELPSTKFFSMDFPTVITLSPGMQTSLDVAFRPVKLEEYDDFVTFNVHIIEGGVTASSGKFRLPVIARIAALSIEIPDGIDFGFSPTAEISKNTFYVRNNGQVDAIFDWTVPAAGEHGSPFAVLPSSGQVNAGDSIELTASFCPSSASVYVTTTACVVRPIHSGEAFAVVPKLVQFMKISGIGKFTNLSASETELNFGEILVGAVNTARTPTEREFVLRNRSLVRASFRIVNVENDHDPLFFFSPLQGVVPPESSLAVKVRYTPLSAGTFTCDHFDILTPGGNCVRMCCKGKAIGPTVSIWKKNNEANFVQTRSVNFQDVMLGKSSSRVITLRNESPIEVFFHFDCQQQGAFTFDKVNGRIPPFLDMSITISFTPTQVGNFYRRFFLLIQNQTTMYVDVLGTAYDEKTRPSPFQQAHIDAYRFRQEAGFGLLSPDELEMYWQENGGEMFLQGALQRAKLESQLIQSSASAGEKDRRQHSSPGRSSQSTSSSSAPVLPPQNKVLTRSGEASMAEVSVCYEYFLSVEAKSNPLAIIHGGSLLEFGNCSIVQFPSKKTLHVTNYTHGKVTCSWKVSMASTNAYSSNQKQELPVFQVFPESSDINAGATAEFRIAFQPSQVNTYYFAELEGFVSFKSNRTFRLVNVETFTPPWCLVARVCGNTFASPTEQFLSKLTFRLAKNKVQFPPCYLGESVFQTVLMDNNSDTPAVFAFVADPSEVFACKPSVGYIAPKSFHLVQIRFTPRKPKKYTYLLQCIVNNAHSKPETMELIGICALPAVVIQGDCDDPAAAACVGTSETKVYIKPTAIGLQSVRSITLLNISRVPLVFRWEIPRKYQDIFHVTPKLGRLNGRETVAIACAFSPTEIKEYVSRFIVSVKPISFGWNQRHATQRPNRISVLQESTVRVQTKGTTGAILFEPETLQFETILVNTIAKQSFWIVNTADCDLTYSLHQLVTTTGQHQVSGDNEDDHLQDSSTATLEFSEDHGCISAHSRKKITATFLPGSAGVFIFQVSCVIGDQSSSLISPFDQWERKNNPLASPPCIIIQAEASFPTILIEDIRVPGQPTQLSWHQFQCDAINEYLLAPLTKEEEQLNSSKLSSKSGSGLSPLDTVNDAPLKHFTIPFSPAPFKAPTEHVYLRLKNPGSLVVEFRLRYPKEGNVEIEHWAETGAPSNEELRLNAIIDSKVFTISPRRATLLPRQSIILTLSYAYMSKEYGGVHDLPIQLEVEKGKKLLLEFQGRTLACGEPQLFLPQRVYHLSPVMIGEFRHIRRHHSQEQNADDTIASSSRPPYQQIQVFNRGESALRLEIDSHTFTRVNNDNLEYPVLLCPTTSELIPAKSSIYLDIEFNPIESKTIEASLVLKASGLMGNAYKETIMVTVVATGYHPAEATFTALREKLMATESPRKQLATIPDQSVRFISDFLNFSHVPVYAQVTHLLVLENKCDSSNATTAHASSRSITYEWDTIHPLVTNGIFQFSPQKGELGPGEKVLIRVTVITSGEVLVVNHDVACFISYRTEESATDGRSKSSPIKSSSVHTASVGKTVQPRTSVITRSTATQAAASDKNAKLSQFARFGNQTSSLPSLGKFGSKETRTSMDKTQQSHTTIAAQGVSSQSVTPTTTPLFVRIFAHILPRSILEQHYPLDTVTKMPLPLTNSHFTSESASVQRDTRTPTTRFTRAHTPSTPSPTSFTIHENSSSSRITGLSNLEGAAAEDCCNLLYGVMEALVVDVLSSSCVQHAINRQVQPLTPIDRALRHCSHHDSGPSSNDLPICKYLRQSEDCQAILSNVMENTVFNIIQELFHGDIDEELLCVPKKEIFPTPKSLITST